MSKTTKKTSARKKAGEGGGEAASPESTPVRKKSRITKKTTATRSKRTSKSAAAAGDQSKTDVMTEAKSVADVVVAKSAKPAAQSSPKPRAPVETQRETTREVSRATAPSGGARKLVSSSFGAGLFDEDDSVAVAEASIAPVAEAKRKDDGGKRLPPSAPAAPSVKPVAKAPTGSESAHSVEARAKDKEKEKEKEALRRKGWKSRKQRLAEEAEVIATIAKKTDPLHAGGTSRQSRDNAVSTDDDDSRSRGLGQGDRTFGEGFASDHDDDMLDEMPPSEVLILPVDDSPLASTEDAETVEGVAPTTTTETEQEEGRRRRRRRGRRGRGGKPGRESREGRDGPGMESVGDTVVPFDMGEDVEASDESVERAKAPTRRPAADEWDGEVDVDQDEADLDEDVSRPDDSGEVREMLINVAEQEECRIAIVRDGRLDELFIERTATSSNVGNIYKGRVTNVEPSIQAAFIDFGLPAHGFLHISDLHPQHFPDGKAETTEQVGKKTPRRSRPPIQNCLKRGQEVIVQVIKEGIGTKGPTLTSYISLPGRFLVMMPGMDQLGVSRKIEDEDHRRRLRAMLEELTLPKAMGFIVRTAGIDHSRKDLQRDLNFLVRLWRQVEKRIKSDPAPAELYKESDLVIRTIRDVYDSTLRRIVIDSEDVAERVREFLAIASPTTTDVVESYSGDEPLFHRFGIESEIDRLHSKTVPLPSGGSLIIEQTEAMVAIDVNSGRFRVPENAEETAYRVNLEAVDEIARQLRLRDLGGLIVCDLIDMGLERHRRAVERLFAEGLRKHKERAKILRISRFGLLEMTRQRQRPSLLKSVFRDCPRCNGSGRVKSPESVALDIMRQIRLASNREGVARIDVRVSTMVANDLLNRKRHQLTDLERTKEQLIQIHGVESFGVDQVELSCSDRRGRDVHGGVAQNSGNGSGQPRHGHFQQQQRGGRRRGRGGRGRGGRN